MASQEFLWKPKSDHGSLVILTPNQFNDRIGQVELINEQGSVIEQGRFDGNNKNGNRGHFRFARPGNQYGANIGVRVSFDDGSEPIFIPVGNGATRLRGTDLSNLQPDRNHPSDLSGQAGGFNFPGTQLMTSAGGNIGAFPAQADFRGGLTPLIPFLDFPGAIGAAQGVGQQNVQTFLQNIDRFADPAKQLVQTDVEGIKSATEQLAPFAREQGQQDLSANIQRAGQIDEFNLQRTPKFNVFNQEQQQQQVEAAGLDFKSRIGGVLDKLETQTEGKLSDEFLNNMITTRAQNRGADIATATGAGARTGAAARLQDRLDIDERLDLALKSQQLLPQVLAQGQQTLQAPTIFAQPTDVPLPVSQVERQIPVTSNISAGEAQAKLAGQATELSTLAPSQILSEGLRSQQFNQQAAFNTEQFLLETEQAANTSMANVVQSLINADKQDFISQQSFDFMEQELDQRQTNQLIGAGTELLGIGLGTLASTPATGGAGGAGGLTGGSGAAGGGSMLGQGLGGLGSFGSSAVNSVLSAGNSLFKTGGEQLAQAEGAAPTPTETVSVGDLQVDSAGWDSMSSNITSLYKPTPTGTTVTPAAETPSSTADVFHRLTKSVEAPRLDQGNVFRGSNMLANWGQLSANDRLVSPSQLSVEVLQEKGVFSGNEAGDIKAGINTVSTMISPSATESQKMAALQAMSRKQGLVDFMGSPDAPASINNRNVVDTIVTDDGDTQYILEDGTVVDKSSLLDSTRATSELQFLSFLTSGASRDDKLLTLTRLGYDTEAANQLINRIDSGDPTAALSVINTSKNWEDMNSLEKATTVMQTSSTVYNLMSEALRRDTGSSYLSFASRRT